MNGRILDDAGRTGAPLDPMEVRLILEVEQRRAELKARAEAFSRTLKSTFDPRESMKRHPGKGLLASVATGLAFGFFPSLRRPSGQTSGAGVGSSLSPRALAGDVLKNFGPPFLSSILSGFLRR